MQEGKERESGDINRNSSLCLSLYHTSKQDKAALASLFYYHCSPGAGMSTATAAAHRNDDKGIVLFAVSTCHRLA